LRARHALREIFGVAAAQTAETRDADAQAAFRVHWSELDDAPFTP
jgi:hypothetical protein